MSRFFIAPLLGGAALLWLGACASAGPGTGHDFPSGGKAASLLAQPLSAETAVQAALLNNHELQAAVHQPGRRDARVAELAGRTRIAYYEAVAASETARYRQQVLEAAEAGADLARQMAEKGNWSKAEQAREQGFRADAELGLARARLAETAARQHLASQLGWWGDASRLALPERLPELPHHIDDLQTLERHSLEQGLDRPAVQAALKARPELRRAYAAYQASYGIARQMRDEVLPLRQRIAEANLLRYNGMLIGVFELLAGAREQIASVEGYIAALRDFWVAQATLDQLMLNVPALPAAEKE